MAGQRLTDKSALTEQLSNGDLLMVVDVSDTTGSAAGTSKKIETKYIMQTDKVSINNAEFLALATTGKTIVAAQGSGYVIIPVSVYAEYTEGGTPNTNTLYPTVGFVDGSSTFYWDQQRYWLDSPTYTSGANIFSGGSSSSKGLIAGGSTLDNVALYFYLAVAPTGGATGTLDLYVTYNVVKRS